MDTSKEFSIEKRLEILKDIFENVNKWLHFAEAKNAALIGLNGVFLFKSIDFLRLSNNQCIGLPLLSTLLFLAGIFISLFSFLPNVAKIKEIKIDVDNEDNKNNILIFFSDIKDYKDSKQFLVDIHKFYFNNNIDKDLLNKIELDYAKEIHINSLIASKKYKLFKWSLKLNLVAIFILFFSIILSVFNK